MSVYSLRPRAQRLEVLGDMRKSIALGVAGLAVIALLVAAGWMYRHVAVTLFLQLFEAPPPEVPPPTASPGPIAPPANSGPQIPDQPASGSMQGAPFTPDYAAIEGGVLTLQQGDEPLATEVTIFLFTQPWEVPAGASFKIVPRPLAGLFPEPQGAPTPNVPHVRVHWRESGQHARRSRDFSEGYTLTLELGQERDGKLPGKIYLGLPDDDKSFVAGTFDAQIKGFRMKNGEPDLSADAIDTLQFLALMHVLRDAPHKPIKNPVFRHAYLRAGPDAPQPPVGYVELVYVVNDKEAVEKLQFVKQNDRWRVARTLKPGQLDAARPYQPPTATDPPERVFPYLVARRVEAEAPKRFPGRHINSTEFVSRYSVEHRIGVCEVSYKAGDTHLVQAVYLLQLKPKGWVLVRELSKKEKVNLATGQIETQR